MQHFYFQEKPEAIFAFPGNKNVVADGNDFRKTCRDDWIRTSDLVVPNDARYRAALHPEIGCGCEVWVWFLCECGVGVSETKSALCKIT